MKDDGRLVFYCDVRLDGSSLGKKDRLAFCHAVGWKQRDDTKKKKERKKRTAEFILLATVRSQRERREERDSA